MNKEEKHSQITRDARAESARRKTKPLFETGRVLIERDALDTFGLAHIDEFLADHVQCLRGPCSDWGQVDEMCLNAGGPMFSLFRNESGDECYIVTEPDRSSTLIKMKAARTSASPNRNELKTQTSLWIPEDVVVAIMKVLDYTFEDEALAYHNALWFERKHHIYPSLICIERWLMEVIRGRNHV